MQKIQLIFNKYSCPLPREPCDNTSRIHLLQLFSHTKDCDRRIDFQLCGSARTYHCSTFLTSSAATLHPCSWYAVQAQMLVDGAPTHGHFFQELNPDPITSSYTFESTSSHRQFRRLISHPLLCLSNFRAKTSLCVCSLLPYLQVLKHASRNNASSVLSDFVNKGPLWGLRFHLVPALGRGADFGGFWTIEVALFVWAPVF
jgi:hypothetical protein